MVSPLRSVLRRGEKPHHIEVDVVDDHGALVLCLQGELQQTAGRRGGVAVIIPTVHVEGERSHAVHGPCRRGGSVPVNAVAGR